MYFLAISFLITLIVLVFLLKTRLGLIALDHPNHRSLHAKAIPRTGGMAIICGVFVNWFLLGGDAYWMSLTAALVSLSILDDIQGLPIKLRFLIQFIISVIFVWLFLSSISIWILALLVISIVWMTNLYNFMDGSDGLAGGMTLFGFGAYAIAAYFAGDKQLAFMAGGVASASFAFLLFNFYPAKIFMGDGGSIPLGFLAITMGLYGWELKLWPLWFPVIVFSPFIVDATITLVNRVLSKNSIFHAHRNHYYQRLIRMGLGHKYTAIAEYILMCLSSCLAILMLTLSLAAQLMSLLILALVYFILMSIIDRKWNKYSITM